MSPALCLRPLLSQKIFPLSACSLPILVSGFALSSLISFSHTWQPHPVPNMSPTLAAASSCPKHVSHTACSLIQSQTCLPLYSSSLIPSQLCAPLSACGLITSKHGFHSLSVASSCPQHISLSEPFSLITPHDKSNTQPILWRLWSWGHYFCVSG